MKILIIGGSSFIGPYVVRRLLDLGHEVVLFNRGNKSIDSEIPVIKGDRRQLSNYVDQLKDVKADVVIDMIPMTEEDASSLVNVLKGISPRIVAISSMDVYRAYGILRSTEEGEIQKTPIIEKSEVRKKLYPYNTPENKSEYDKILVEKVIMNSPDIQGTVLRLPMVYGPNDKQYRLFQYIKRMQDSRPAIILDKDFSEWKWTKGYVENVAEAIALATVKGEAAGEIYNVAEKNTLSFYNWVAELKRIYKWKGEIVVIPKEKLPEDFRVSIRAEQNLLVDSSKIRDQLGFKEIVDFDEGIARTIEWELNNPPSNAQFNYEEEDKVLENYMT